MSVIEEQIQFETFNDFYIRRHKIRDVFSTMSQTQKEIYRYYIYANSILSQLKKDIIWEYLVEPKTSPFYVWERDLKRYYNKSKYADKYQDESESGIIDNRGEY